MLTVDVVSVWWGVQHMEYIMAYFMLMKCEICEICEICVRKKRSMGTGIGFHRVDVQGTSGD